MTDLVNAMAIRTKYNQMDFDAFVDEYEKHFDVKVSEKYRKEWKFMGLNNVDFLKHHENI
tara:strand:- start:40834 stop:41013 length:180 start_codon:yes stop_codon:yes gene_type:complete